MPKKSSPKIIAWSFSRWSTHNQCPFKLKCQAIDKVPEEKNPALINGIKVHNVADDYVSHAIKKIPKELRLFEEKFKDLQKAYVDGDVDCEQMICFDKDWNFVKDKFAPNVWVRIKTDVSRFYDDGIVKIIDYKTGKVKHEGYIAQLELYALACMLYYDGVKRVDVELWFLDHGVIKPDEPLSFDIKDLNKLKRKWEKRVKPMLNDRRFEPTPNQYCNWCSFRKAKGGPCKY